MTGALRGLVAAALLGGRARPGGAGDRPADHGRRTQRAVEREVRRLLRRRLSGLLRRGRDRGPTDPGRVRRGSGTGACRRRANVAIERMPAALAARERGIPLVNIGQLFARPAAEVICRAESGVRTPCRPAWPQPGRMARRRSPRHAGLARRPGPGPRRGRSSSSRGPTSLCSSSAGRTVSPP